MWGIKTARESFNKPSKMLLFDTFWMFLAVWCQAVWAPSQVCIQPELSMRACEVYPTITIKTHFRACCDVQWCSSTQCVRCCKLQDKPKPMRGHGHPRKKNGHDEIGQRGQRAWKSKHLFSTQWALDGDHIFLAKYVDQFQHLGMGQDHWGYYMTVGVTNESIWALEPAMAWPILAVNPGEPWAKNTPNPSQYTGYLMLLDKFPYGRS